jgi:alpha-tubulin suppressor-like RCC1 family protein
MRFLSKNFRVFLTVLAALALAANLPAQAQNLFEADWSIFYSGNNIYQFTPDGSKTTFATGVFQAVGLAFDNSSNLFVANGVVGTITKITPNGTQSTFASGLSYPFGLAFNTVGNLFEADLGSGNIYQFTPDGAQTTFASGLNRPCALAVDSAGNLFESDQGSGNVYKFTPNGSQSTFASGFIEPNGLAFNKTGDLFLADEDGGNVYKFTPDGTRSIFASDLNHPSGLAIDDAGDVFVGDEGDGTIYKFTPDGTPSVFATGLNVPNGLAFQRSPGTLTPRILRVPADYPTIQWAINEASYFVTDTVLVTNGIYYENLDFGGKAVTVTSVNGPDATIIDGGHVGPVVNFSSGENSNSVISGFTLQNGHADWGAGITVQSASPTILNNVFQNNAQGDGGFGAGVGGNNASPIIEQNLFQNNSADSQYLSGVVSFVNGSSPLIADNVFENNPCLAINIVIPAGYNPIVINNTIVNNNEGISANAGLFYNNILVNNGVGVGSAGATWQNNLVYGGQTLYAGQDLTGTNGNISANPWFACQPSGDFHLLAGSPCIDAGTNVAQLPAVDFDGNPRILAGNSNNVLIVDMGAYEFNPSNPPVPCMFINCQTDIVTNTAPGQNSLVVNFPTPTDATPVATVICSPPSGSTFFGGTNVITCTATYGTNTVSCSFNIIVIVAPSIIQQPQNTTVSAGQSFTLSVGVSGTLPMSYQWLYQGNAITSATNSTLTVVNAQAVSDGVYSVFIQNLAGSTNSSLARVRVLPAKPTIVTNPASLNVLAGSNVVLNVTATGSQPLYYQWFCNNKRIPGANTAQLVLANVQFVNTGSYQVTVSNAIGVTTSLAARLVVRPSVPYFNIQPASTSVLFGSTATLTSLAAGTQPIRYQWYFHGSPLRNQTNAKLVVSNATPNLAGDYFVTAENVYGTTKSVTAQLTVNVPPQPVHRLTNQIVEAGSDVTLNFSANGSSPMSYSWQFDDIPIIGTNSILNITNIPIEWTGYYQVTASNAYGSTSSVARVSVVAPPSRLVAWGDNSGGQLNVPAGLTNIVGVAGGDFDTVAIRANGTLAAWGANDEGQTNLPHHLHPIAFVAAGASHNLALDLNGSIIAWGNNTSGQCTIPAAATNQPLTLAAGDAHSLALLANGTVVAWGDNTYGQTSLPDVLTPGYYFYEWWDGQNVWISNPDWVPAQAIAAGRIHNLAVLNNGTVVGWGDNSFGQLNIPPGLTNATAVAGGYLHSVALRDDGTVVAWGDDTYGQTDVPFGLTNVVAVAAGDFNTLALLANGTVVGWGDDLYGQIDIPASVTNVVSIAAGYYHSLALVPSSAR